MGNGRPRMPEMSRSSRSSRWESRSAEECLAVARRVRAGDREAYRDMVEANLGLAFSFARKYEGLGVDYEDLVQAGNEGLIEAVERFDPERGYKFSTYAGWWVLKGIKRALSNEGRTIRLPTQITDLATRIRRAEENLIAEGCCEPSEEEVAARVGVSKKKLRSVREATLTTTSVDAPVEVNTAASRSGSEEEGGLKKGESMGCESAGQEMAGALGYEWKAELEAALGKLSAREALMVAQRYGLGGRDAHTLREIAAVAGISQERTRQIIKKALYGIRTGRHASPLRSALDTGALEEGNTNGDAVSVDEVLAS